MQKNTGAYTQASLQFGANVAELAGKKQGLSGTFNITSLQAEYDFGIASLLSSSSWFDNDAERHSEQSAFVGGMPIGRTNLVSTEVFTQELRLVSQLNGAIQYVAGFYYEDVERDDVTLHYSTADLDKVLDFIGLPFGPENPLFDVQTVKRPLRQAAFYTELSYQLSERWSLTGGLRFFDYEKEDYRKASGSLTGGFNVVTDSITEEDGTSSKVNLSYRLHDGSLLYTQWAEGFRLGTGITPPPASLCDVNNDGVLDGTSVVFRDSLASDTTENIEFGIKTGLV